MIYTRIIVISNIEHLDVLSKTLSNSPYLLDTCNSCSMIIQLFITNNN